MLGDGLTTITVFMFQGLQALKEVIIGENVTTIDSYAFDGCTTLNNVVIPNSVIKINGCAFRGCVSLKDITFGNSITTIGSSTFSGCTSLTNIKLPSTLKTISSYAFADCTLLEKIELNEGLTTIQYNAFKNTGIIELIIPDSVTSITNDGSSSNYSFVEGCQKLERVVLGEGLTAITVFMFQGLTSLKEVVIGDNITTIGSYAFDGCTELSSITIPESVSKINSYAFRGTGLKNIKIPEGVITIGDYAFTSCLKLEYILIDGTTLKTVGKNVTSSCPQARRIYYKGTITEWNAISINSTNAAPFNQLPYIYSETQPTQEGNYWHYSWNDQPIVWDITLSEYKIYALANAYTGTMGSSLLSCSSNYVKEMENDKAFMTQKSIYETATLVTDLGTAADNQMNKEQLYMIVLLDILGYNQAGTSETSTLDKSILTYGTFIGTYIGNASKLVDVAAFKETMPALKFITNGWNLIFDLANTAQDKQAASEYLLGFALHCQNSIDILTNIAGNSKNEKNLRNAANKVIEIITSAFEGTLQDLIDKDMNIANTKNISKAAINTIWDVGCSLYLPAKIAQWIATGVKITLNLFHDTGVSVDAYYKLKVTSVIENALRTQVQSLNGDYLRRENLKESASLYAVIDLYCSAITRGYEYTFDYLDSVDKDSSYIYQSYVNNNTAFKQFENEVEREYYSLYR